MDADFLYLYASRRDDYSSVFIRLAYFYTPQVVISISVCGCGLLTDLCAKYYYFSFNCSSVRGRGTGIIFCSLINLNFSLPN